MEPEPFFRETRVTEPRIEHSPSRCDRTGHENPGTAIQLLAPYVGSLAAFFEIVPTLDADNLIGINTGTSQKLSNYASACLSQCVRASLRAAHITRPDYQNSSFMVLSKPDGRSLQRVLPRNRKFKAVWAEQDRLP